MTTFQMKTYKTNFKTEKPHFFMLSKGNNSGKPMNSPCPNCFVVITATVEARQFYFWLSYGLWQAHAFRSLLTGSVIPFIRIREAKDLLSDSAEKALKDRQKCMKALAMLQDFDKKSEILEKQVKLVKDIKRAIMPQVLKQ